MALAASTVPYARQLVAKMRSLDASDSHESVRSFQFFQKFWNPSLMESLWDIAKGFLRAISVLSLVKRKLIQVLGGCLLETVFQAVHRLI